jgi:hypothetical protein
MTSRAKRTQVRNLQRRLLRQRIDACLAGFPGRDASPEQRRAWRDTFGRLTEELSAQTSGDLNEAVVDGRIRLRDDGTNTGLQWTAEGVGCHTATGPNTVTAKIRPATADAFTHNFVWHLQTPDETIGGGRSPSVDAAKTAAAKAHNLWLDLAASRARLDHHLATRDRQSPDGER